MPSAPVLALVATLATLLAVTSATAVALWRRSRGAADLAARLAALERRLDRLEQGRPKPLRPDPPASAAVPGPTLIAVPDLAAPAATPPPSAELARRFGAIWTLADSGTPADVIARRTGQPIGQVELILGLRRRLASASGARPS